MSCVYVCMLWMYVWMLRYMVCVCVRAFGPYVVYVCCVYMFSLLGYVCIRVMYVCTPCAYVCAFVHVCMCLCDVMCVLVCMHIMYVCVSRYVALCSVLYVSVCVYARYAF